MAKDKMMEFYRAGMERAYRLYKEEGAEALEKEIRFRNTTHINSPLLAKEIDKSIDEIKWHTIQTVMAMAIGVLYSEFGFGKKRIERFRDAFTEATSGLEDGIVTWADICLNIEDLTGVKVDLIDRLSKDTGMIREG
jgi:hypothetical protein